MHLTMKNPGYGLLFTNWLSCNSSWQACVWIWLSGSEEFLFLRLSSRAKLEEIVGYHIRLPPSNLWTPQTVRFGKWTEKYHEIRVSNLKIHTGDSCKSSIQKGDMWTPIITQLMNPLEDWTPKKWLKIQDAGMGLTSSGKTWILRKPRKTPVSVSPDDPEVTKVSFFATHVEEYCTPLKRLE